MPTLKLHSDPSGEKFEAQCLLIFEKHFDSDDANFYGRKGLGQDGIDIRMTNGRVNHRERVIIQCKDVPKLYWKTFKTDFDAALRAFSPRSASDPAIFYIVASTAHAVNTKYIERKVEEAKAALLLEQPERDLNRVRFEVFARKRIEGMVDGNQYLRDAFCREPRAPDREKTKRLLDLMRVVAEAYDSGNLRTARDALMTYLSALPSADRDHYKWAPSVLVDDLLAVFMKAGDFKQADKLLDVGLGIDPLKARYLLALLRSQRVLYVFHRENGPPKGLVPVPAVMSIQYEVAFRIQNLVTALGTPDEQLTLALWVVSYAQNARHADAGLRRARGLIELAWPEKIRRLQAGKSYSISSQGYLWQDGEDEPLPAKVCYGGLDASALTAAYSYVRLVHACRFGMTHTLNVETEQELGGWPARIDGFGRAEVDFFFSPLHNVVKAVLRRRYPYFYDEGRGREFHWPLGDEFLSSFQPVLTPGRYVCTSEFLLRDCADKLIDNRFAELALRGINGITLITSNHALERLARVQAVHQIMLPNAGVFGAHSESMLTQIDKVIGKTVRIEAAERLVDKHPIAVYPGYYDFGGEACNSFTQTVTLCLDKYSDFIAASHLEYSRAADRLVAPRQQLQYWRPLNPALSVYWRN